MTTGAVKLKPSTKWTGGKRQLLPELIDLILFDGLYQLFV